MTSVVEMGPETTQSPMPAGVVFLDTPIEWMRPCFPCARETRFIADRAVANGLIAHCSICGDELVAPFTRTIDNAA